MLRRRARPASRLLLVLLVVPFLGMGCDNRPKPSIATPASGIFTTAGSVLVTGSVAGNLSQLAELTVNGVPTPLSGRNFSATVTLNPGTVFNPIVAEVRRVDNTRARARVTVIAGASVADGGFSFDGVGMRLNDSGLDSLEPSLSDMVNLDLATLLPVNTTVISQCMVRDPIFGACLGSANVKVQNPPPTISGFGIAMDSITNAVIGDITVNDLRIDLFIDGSGLVPDCGLRLTADATDIDGSYALAPDGVDPSNVDVNQATPPQVSFVAFDQEYTSGICDAPIIGTLIQLIIGDLEPTVTGGLEDYLADPDGNGPADGPVADAIEVALAGISIAGPIGEAIGVTLEAPLFDVLEDTAGITLGSDARITALMPTPGAPDLTASYHVAEPFPTFGSTAPGGAAYGLALAISSSAFNQLLKAETESGLLRTSLTEVDLGAGPLPLTPANLSTFIPQLAILQPDTPLRIDIQPTLAPVVTGQGGPNGELADLRLGHLTANLVRDDTNKVLIAAAIDVRVGLDVEFTGGQLAFTVGALSPGNLAVTILMNNIGAIDAQLSSLLLFLVPELFPSLAGSLGSFPIPTFLGFELSPVEAGYAGEFLSLYANLVPVP